MNRIDELKSLIKKYDASYRGGNSIVPDSVYDELVDELIELIGADDEFFDNSIKEDTEDYLSDRREQLPEGTIMASMSKVKNIDDLKKWAKLKNIPSSSEVIITPKYDGISLLKNEITFKAYTRGGKNPKGGLQSENHLRAMNDVSIPEINFSYGECIMSRENFKKYLIENGGEEETSASRNITSGVFRRDDISEDLKFIDFIRYGIFDDNKNFNSKKEIIDLLNKTQPSKVKYKIVNLQDITESLLIDLYKEYSVEYEIDGLIIEINDQKLCKELGRQKGTNNPNFAVAFKSKNFDESKITTVIDIEDNISKNGNIIPVAILEPVNIGGVTVSRVTLNNYSFMKELGIGISSSVKVIRSGSVIPLITEVITKKPFQTPSIDCYWDGVHLKTTHETNEQKKKKILAFFRILDVENVSDKTIDLLFESGYETIKDILLMSKNDFKLLERFGERKADVVYDAIHSKMQNIHLSKLQHSTGLFISLGSKKLALLEHFETKPTIEEVMKIDGFSDISAKNYLDGFDDFWSFIEGFPITWIRTRKIEAVSNEFEGKAFCFTGIRDKNIEVVLISKGAKIANGVNSKTTHLIVKEKGSGSSKEQKAIELGIEILTIEELKKQYSI